MEALNEKILETLHEFEQQIQKMKDSQSHQKFQIQDPYSNFSSPTTTRKTYWLRKEYIMIPSQNDYVQSQNNSFNRLGA